MTLTLYPGNHNTVLNLSGYNDWSSKVYVSAGRSQTINPSLTMAIFGSLSIGSAPPSVSVFIDRASREITYHYGGLTLNNIHSLIEMDTKKAQDAVERLSTLMRYLLYHSAQNTIELRKEIEFIHSFIALMQLRHSDEVQVTMLIPKEIPDIKVPPMLFISLVENAFKHGVSYPLKSFIYFELITSDNSLNCIIRNSNHKKTSKSQGEYSGIGLSNIKESLKLLYGDKYSLDIADKANEFEVKLMIPL
ncbi:MAG: histidine kinase [Methanomicrobiales archaeon]